MLTFAFVALALATPAGAHAYTGPGLGLGAVGVALGLVGSLLLGVASIIWYPIKRLVRRMRGKTRS
ncbi:MAG: hypothetical protein EOP61_06245 [Sphingomonadales bacterium]|nr:MAG: hypothetical protein EOP61_06245 [Sphingomonadales bacterium]